jgi:hypothetical protein
MEGILPDVITGMDGNNPTSYLEGSKAAYEIVKDALPKNAKMLTSQNGNSKPTQKSNNGPK